MRRTIQSAWIALGFAAALSWSTAALADGGVTTAGAAMLIILAALVILGVIIGAIAAWFVKRKSGAARAWIWLFFLTPLPLVSFLLYLWYLQSQ